MNDSLILINFAGVFCLLIANAINNFYQSRRIYHLLELVGEGLVMKEERKKSTVDKLMENGMKLEGRTE